jgi:cytochrome c biogenesis protein CcmG/thiol:disulfide interchange protein DsbE
VSGGRRGRTALWASAAVALAAVCLVAVLATRPAGEDTVAASPLVGKPAPAIDARSIDTGAIGGGRVSLAAYRGRFVVVNFFASWCPPCQAEEPQLVEFAAAHRGAGAPAVIGVVFSDSAANAAAFARANGVRWPIVADPGGRIALAFGVADPPDSFLVGPDGRIVADVVGGVTASGLDRLIGEAQVVDP